jgi:hypothetical protein
MKFLEVSKGYSVRLADICAIKKHGELKTSIFVNNDVHIVDFPYSTMYALLNSEENDGSQIRMLKEISQKLGMMGTFAG